MTDFAPALFILLIVVTLPMIDALGVALVYNSGAILNGSQTREAALEPFLQVQDPNGFVQKQLVDQWLTSGMGQFCKLQGRPLTTISYKSGVSGDKIVTVTTKIVASPILSIPFFNGVPVLGAPVPFSYTSEHVVENPENAP